MKDHFDQEAGAELHQIGDLGVEFDVAYSTVTSFYPTFPEVSRIVYISACCALSVHTEVLKKLFWLSNP